VGNALQRLIQNRMAEMGLSYSEVARIGDLPKPTVYALATKAEHRQPPRPDTLKRLARGLSLPLSTIRQAAAEAAGYRLQEVSVDAEDGMRVIVATYEQLNEDQQKAAVRIMKALLDDMGGSDAEEGP
jgi:hypothetical protein